MSAIESGTMPLGRALNAGLRKAMADDDRVLLMGEDIGPEQGPTERRLHAQIASCW